jgi:hypothetical protein
MQVNGIKGYFDPKITPASVPSSEEYQEWLDRPTNRRRPRPSYQGSSLEMTGVKLRRVAIMRRQGETWTDCARAVGYVSGSSVSVYFDMMPQHLQP